MRECGGGQGASTPDDVLVFEQHARHGGAFVFGDGTHPTTRLCAGAVDLLCRQRPGIAVLDVGTGTGILARIARARGATFVVGTDIDPAALEAARGDAALDRGGASITFSDGLPDRWGARFDLVVANILAEPLLALAPSLAAALRACGRLLISGFTPVQGPPLRQAFETVGLHFERDAQQEGWRMSLFERNRE